MRLILRHFRAFSEASFDLTQQEASKPTLILGRNGSGKTSILEAVYLLGSGRAMSGRRIEELIQNGQEKMQAGLVMSGPDTGVTKFSTDVTRGGAAEFKIDSKRVRATSELALELPILPLTPVSLQLIADGPRARRSFIDRSCFYAYTDFREHQARYRQALRQRNSLLRQSTAPDPSMLDAFEAQMHTSGTLIDQRRREQIAAIEDSLHSVAHKSADDSPALAKNGELQQLTSAVSLQLRSGWTAGSQLGDALKASRQRDTRAGYSSVGVQAAEIVIACGERSARDQLSRGQQKLLALVMLLESTLLAQKQGARPTLLLVDDLPSEFDHATLTYVAALLKASQMPLICTLLSQHTSMDTAGAEDSVLKVSSLFDDHATVLLND